MENKNISNIESSNFSIQLDVKSRIFTFRNKQVMIDRDLAELYGVETKRLNEQVKRNIDRFPDEFRFQLTENEKNELVANCDRFHNLKHSTVNPYAFTEQGVAMLSAVLNSKIAINTSIKIMNAFVEMRSFLIQNAQIFQRLESLENKQLEHVKDSDKKFNLLFDALESKSLKTNQGIFYDGQIFDAYTLISDIIRSSTKSIILIDNYLDDTVLKVLSKRNKGISVTLYSKNITEVLKQDLVKHNSQYEKIELRELKTSHDRFLIIDNKDVYHFGASLKDAGKKWFAFSKLTMEAKEIIDRL